MLQDLAAISALPMLSSLDVFVVMRSRETATWKIMMIPITTFFISFAFFFSFIFVFWCKDNVVFSLVHNKMPHFYFVCCDNRSDLRQNGEMPSLFVANHLIPYHFRQSNASFSNRYIELSTFYNMKNVKCKNTIAEK